VPFLKSVRIELRDNGLRGTHPFDVPAIAAMVAHETRLRFDPGVTVFVGDNGSGKSTLLEAIAVSQDLNAEGGSRHIRFQTHDTSVSGLHRHLRVSRSAQRPTDAFFLRAESYFNVATAIEGSGTAHQYGGSPHERSHGESFIDLAIHRFGPGGLYLLDEPEAALSVHGQLQLLVRLHDLVRSGAQFVMATHSPLLMAFPGARIYEFSERGPSAVDWADVDAVRVTTDFLGDPAGFLADLLADDDGLDDG
jgi:predicted ATPase